MNPNTLLEGPLLDARDHLNQTQKALDSLCVLLTGVDQPISTGNLYWLISPICGRIERLQEDIDSALYRYEQAQKEAQP